MGRTGRVGAASLLAWVLAGCGEDDPGREQTGLEALGFDDVTPKIIVPGTVLTIEGRSFLDDPLGISWLRLDGSYAGGLVDAYIPADFIDFTTLQIEATPSVLALLGPPAGSFSGQVSVEVDFVRSGSRFASVSRFMQLEVREHLQPRLDAVQANAVIFVNEPIEVQGAGMLLGGQEGTTFAVVEGCF